MVMDKMMMKNRSRKSCVIVSLRNKGVVHGDEITKDNQPST
jgi:hypothetical protein